MAPSRGSPVRPLPPTPPPLPTLLPPALSPKMPRSRLGEDIVLQCGRFALCTDGGHLHVLVRGVKSGELAALPNSCKLSPCHVEDPGWQQAAATARRRPATSHREGPCAAGGLGTPSVQDACIRWDRESDQLASSARERQRDRAAAQGGAHRYRR